MLTKPINARWSLFLGPVQRHHHKKYVHHTTTQYYNTEYMRKFFTFPHFPCPCFSPGTRKTEQELEGKSESESASEREKKFGVRDSEGENLHPSI